MSSVTPPLNEENGGTISLVDRSTDQDRSSQVKFFFEGKHCVYLFIKPGNIRSQRVFNTTRWSLLLRCSSPGKILGALNTTTVEIFLYMFVSEGTIVILV
jgi:hypothetical protein